MCDDLKVKRSFSIYFGHNYNQLTLGGFDSKFISDQSSTIKI